MAKATIRKSSSQSRIRTEALHQIIISCNAETSMIQQYFKTKKMHGACSAPKPIFSEDVVTQLKAKLRSGSDKRTSVDCVVMCLEEFSTNAEVQKPWSECYSEIAQLVFECLSYFIEIKRNDQKQNTSNFVELSRLFMKLCYVFFYLSEKSDILSTELFNICGKDLMRFLVSSKIDSEMKAVLLQAISALCKNAKTPDIHQSLSSLPVYLSCIAKLVINLTVEAQMDGYTILRTSVVNKENATKLASKWFAKWPVLQDAFTKSCSLSFSTGCGLFLGELTKLKSTAPLTLNTSSSSTYTQRKVDTSKNSSFVVTTQCKSVPSRTTDLPNDEPAVPQKKSHITILQKSSYSDCKKSPPQRRSGIDIKIKGTEVEELQSRGELKINETPIMKKDESFVNVNQKSKSNSTRRLETPRISGAQIAPMEVTVLTNEANTESTSKPIFKTPYPGTRKRLSLRNRVGKDENKSLTQKPTENIRTNNELNFLEDANSEKQTTSKITLKPTAQSTKCDKQSSENSLPQSNKTEKRVTISKPALSNLSTEGQSSKVEKWLSTHTSSDFVMLSDDEEITGKHTDNNCNTTKTLKQTAAKWLSQDSPLLSFSSNKDYSDTHSNLNDRGSTKMTDPLKGSVHFNNANSDENMPPPAKRKKTSTSYLDSSSSVLRNQWERRLRELEENRAEEKHDSKDIYCFTAAVPSTSLKQKRVPATCKSTRSSKHYLNCKTNREKPTGTKKKSLKINKENIDPVGQPFKSSTNHEAFSKNSTGIVQTDRPSYLKEEKKAFKSYTLDSSVKLAQPTKHLHIKGEKSQDKDLSLNPTLSNNSKSRKDKSCFSPILDDSMDTNSAKKIQEKAALCDSGFEVTSGSDGGSHFKDVEEKAAVAPKKHLSKSEYLKLSIRTNLQKALQANADVVSNNEVITTELNEIQNLAQKITHTASRCIAANRENCNTLREQSVALEGCSKYLGPYEDQLFQASVPTTCYTDFKAFKRHLKERNRQRTIEIMRKALDMNFSLSSNSSDEEF